MSTETTPTQVTLVADTFGVDGKRYTIMADGEKVGTVEQIMVTHDRGPRNSPIATSRTRSLRWSSRPGAYSDWQDTRWKAIGGLLRDKFGLSWSDAERLARAARVQPLTPEEPR